MLTDSFKYLLSNEIAHLGDQKVYGMRYDDALYRIN